MALGNSQLNALECDRMDIDLIVDQKMKNSWNTFQFVANELQAWADDTTIGSELRQNLIDLTKGLDDTLRNTRNLTNAVGKFVQNQRRLNDGK